MDTPPETVIWSFLPRGVQRILDTGSMNFVGLIDNSTVLKYPHEPGQGRRSLDIEAAILNVLGSHPRIVKLKGQDEEGLRLEFMPHGRLDKFLGNATSPISLQDRFKWCRQAAEATAYIHHKGVIHCDIKLGNLLLDQNFDIKMCDFQGILRTPDGSVFDGGAGEITKSSLPRSDALHADQTSDIFALGSAIYYIMKNHEPFPELDSSQDEVEILNRYKAGKFPVDLEPAMGGHVVNKCWNVKYRSAEQVVKDLKVLEATILE